MDLLSPSALRRETTTPRTELEDRLSVAVQSFAYPYGYARRQTRTAVQSLGYDNACGVADLVSTATDDLFALPVSRSHRSTTVRLSSPCFTTAAGGWTASTRRCAQASPMPCVAAGVKKRDSVAYSRALT